MDIKQIRISNLRFILNSSGLQRDEFAQKIGYSDTNYFNQLIKGHGSFGSNTARKIESKLGLSSGYIDMLHGDTVQESKAIYEFKESLLTPFQKAILDKSKNLSKDDQAELLNYLNYLAHLSDQKTPPSKRDKNLA